MKVDKRKGRLYCSNIKVIGVIIWVMNVGKRKGRLYWFNSTSLPLSAATPSCINDGTWKLRRNCCE